MLCLFMRSKLVFRVMWRLVRLNLHSSFLVWGMCFCDTPECQSNLISCLWKSLNNQKQTSWGWSESPSPLAPCAFHCSPCHRRSKGLEKSWTMLCNLGGHVYGGMHRWCWTMAPWLPLGVWIKSLDPLSDTSVLQRVLLLHINACGKSMQVASG